MDAGAADGEYGAGVEMQYGKQGQQRTQESEKPKPQAQMNTHA